MSSTPTAASSRWSSGAGGTSGSEASSTTARAVRPLAGTTRSRPVRWWSRAPRPTSATAHAATSRRSSSGRGLHHRCGRAGEACPRTGERRWPGSPARPAALTSLSYVVPTGTSPIVTTFPAGPAHGTRRNAGRGRGGPGERMGTATSAKDPAPVRAMVEGGRGEERFPCRIPRPSQPRTVGARGAPRRARWAMLTPRDGGAAGHAPPWNDATTRHADLPRRTVMGQTVSQAATFVAGLAGPGVGGGRHGTRPD